MVIGPDFLRLNSLEFRSGGGSPRSGRLSCSRKQPSETMKAINRRALGIISASMTMSAASPAPELAIGDQLDTKQVFRLSISVPTFVLYVMYNNALRMGCGQEPVKPEEACGHRF
jgi:hypothetical protein